MQDQNHCQFLMALGVITIALSFLAGDQIPVLYMAADHYDFIPGFIWEPGSVCSSPQPQRSLKMSAI